MTSSEPELAEVDQVTTAVVRGVVPMAELPGFFDGAFRRLPETIIAQQAAILSPAFALYNAPPGETADLEVGFVTDRPVRAEGDVVAGTRPATRVARMTHSGTFDGLGASWERLKSWIEAQGLTPGPVLWEVYVTQPTPDMDPGDLRTELNWTLAD
ncbi:MAG: GyrI-like domain-containing protein [Streptomyces sp.]|uniref:GyrI-like domain-containing protein n=1 Tax=Streptomyces sp. TaxID=1931 RepID=UPI003D6A8836